MSGDDCDSETTRVKRAPRKRVLVVTEGIVTEKEYFEKLKVYLELSKPQLDVHVECGPDHAGNTPSKVVQSAIAIRDAAKAKQEELDDLGSLVAREEYDQVWVVFDTETPGRYQDLLPAAERAHSCGLKVAISRPCFESWFLLHLRDGLPAMVNCDDACKYITGFARANYDREYHKESREDLEWLIKLILPETEQAIHRSKRQSQTAYTSHELVPEQSGTKVHELVEALWLASPKGSRRSTTPILRHDLRCCQPVPTSEFISAIMSGELSVEAFSEAIRIMIAQREVASIGCNTLNRPSARVASNPLIVNVAPSSSCVNGFTIACETRDDATLIAAALDGHLKSAYDDQFRGL